MVTYFKLISIAIIGLALSSCFSYTSLTREQVNNFKSDFVKKKLTYINKEKINKQERISVIYLNKILFKVKKHYFSSSGKYLNIKILLDKREEKFSIEALPDNNILITKGYLDLIKRNVFSDVELTATLCHEVAHIANDDWGQQIIVETTKPAFQAKIARSELRDFLKGSFLSAGASALLGSTVGVTMSSSSTTSSYNKNTGEYEMVPTDSRTHKINVIIPDILSPQGFDNKIELQADKDSVQCLKSLNYDGKAMLDLLIKIEDFPYVNKKQINNRIKFLKEII